MRPPRLILLVFCFIFFPIFLTIFSFLFSSPRVTTPNALAGRSSGLHALFSFNIPSSLFPPSAIISLTDDNSTFFLARPAAFGPLLASTGLSGQLWVGSGFGDTAGTSGPPGELGCSDIPGWEEGDNYRRQDRLVAGQSLQETSGKSTLGSVGDSSRIRRRSDAASDTASESRKDAVKDTPSQDDGTDDHLHHPLRESGASASPVVGQSGDRHQGHADIQSLQESAEIAGKIVLLSRGGCGFLEKVKWVQRRGGIAMIVGDDTRGGSLVTMYARGDTSNVTIPSVFTSYTTAHLLSSLIPAQHADETSRDTGPSRTSGNAASNGNGAKASSNSATSIAATSTSTPTKSSSDTLRQVAPKTEESGFFRKILSLLGLGGGTSQSYQVTTDRHRPPSSGNIDWIRVDSWEDEPSSEPEVKVPSGGNAVKGKIDGKATSSKKSGPIATPAQDDGFVIGVHDWRDPDLIPPMSTSSPTSIDVSKTDSGKPRPTGTSRLKGGIITPGSGEYRTGEESSKRKKPSAGTVSGRPGGQDRPPAPSPGWFARHFGWGGDAETGVRQATISFPEDSAKAPAPHKDLGSSDNGGASKPEHEGLWVTLTPTDMSTSPFLDTLLVLVMSPLFTLTVVYTLLLLRSRIRRRRWRAPKSVVERLPVRTYHTMSPSSPRSRTPRSSSPGSPTLTSPLLASGTRRLSRSRPRSRTTSGVLTGTCENRGECQTLNGEKSHTDSATWRRKYIGRQVECVVCLEEYVDGQSRVMSLPCGHEFHAECITPWLTTRRRTCPICKGDVVRSLTNPHRSENGDYPVEGVGSDGNHPSTSRSGPIRIIATSEDEFSDLEDRDHAETGLLGHRSSSGAQSSWRNLASLSLSALSGDTVWPQQSQSDRTR